MNDWINTKDQLPEKGVEVLFYFRHVKRVIAGAYDPFFIGAGMRVRYICSRNGGAIGKIKDASHWMPLPDAPKEGGQR